jgi:repressor LexA
MESARNRRAEMVEFFQKEFAWVWFFVLNRDGRNGSRELRVTVIAGMGRRKVARVKGLTKKQQRIFDFIRAQIIETNRPPTIREIGHEFTMSSTGSVRDVIRALVKKGFIQKDAGLSRGIRITAGPGPLSGNIVEVPVIGKIAAGTPIDAVENVEETLKLDKSMVPDGQVFIVKVKGDSMKDAGINNGDYAFIRRQPTCRSGQVIAVLLDEEVTLKEFSKKGHSIKLLPHNRKYKPITIEPARLRMSILGILVGVFRKF